MFLSVLLHLDVVSNRKSCSRLRFILQIATFFSGAEEIRTPDLRRAKAARYFARGFWSLQNACKSSCFPIDAFLKVSGYLLGLLHGCCTRTGRNQGRPPSGTWLEELNLSTQREGRYPTGTSFPPVRSTHPPCRLGLDSTLDSRRRPRLRQLLHLLLFACRPACAPARGSPGRGPGRYGTARRTPDGSPPRVRRWQGLWSSRYQARRGRWNARPRVHPRSSPLWSAPGDPVACP